MVSMKRSTTVAVFALLGALWMALVLYMGWFSLAFATNYPGMLAANLVRYKGVAPSSMMVWMFNLWLILTSALEWVAVGLLMRRILRLHGSKV
jgi:hypothetical protein